MKNLKDILDEKSFGGVPVLDEKTIEAIFLQAAEGAIKGISRSDIQKVRLKSKVLFVGTAHPMIASEVWRAREKVKNLMNEKLGKKAVEAIKVK